MCIQFFPLGLWLLLIFFIYFFNGKRCRENKASQYLQKFIFGIMSVIGQPLVSLPGLNFPSFHCSQIYRYVGAKAGWSMRLTLYRVGVHKCSSQTPYRMYCLPTPIHTSVPKTRRKQLVLPYPRLTSDVHLCINLIQELHTTCLYYISTLLVFHIRAGMIESPFIVYCPIMPVLWLVGQLSALNLSLPNSRVVSRLPKPIHNILVISGSCQHMYMDTNGGLECSEERDTHWM